MSEFARQFRDHGWCILRAWLPRARVSRLRGICDRILEIWKREQGGEEALRRATSAAFFPQPRYFEEDPGELRELLELISDERVLALLREVAGTGALFFRNDQYFYEPAFESFEGGWHRDS